MDVVDDAEGPLDPRIQIELENLNNATDEINKLEIELDEAHTAFRQLLSDSTRRLKEIANKLGVACIEKARCYYKAVEVARQAQVQCQRQAQMFQRASEIHAAAKETVALAEARFMSHQHEWNFDQAWQDMLNHATIKVMDAENQKAECAREHHRRAMLFHDAEKKVQQLDEKHRRAIIKSRPYFEVRAQCDEMLATQKERVECLQMGVKDAKTAYATSLRVLEEISNQIHQQRRDYDIVAKGPREPGVGAELISPSESLSYEAELNKLSISRVNSLASSEPDTEDRARDFEDVHELQQRMEQLSGRSVDGSESTSSQWELELQASVEKLNSLSIRKSNYEDTDKINKDIEGMRHREKSDLESSSCSGECGNSDATIDSASQSQKSLKNDQNAYKKFANDSQYSKKPLGRTVSTSQSQGWQSLTQSPINSILNKSRAVLKNSISKSLSSSPVNTGSFSLGRALVDSIVTQSKRIQDFRARNDNDLEGTESKESCEKIAPQSIKCREQETTDGTEAFPNTAPKKKISVDKYFLEIAESTDDDTESQEDFTIQDTNDKQDYQCEKENNQEAARRFIPVSESGLQRRVYPQEFVPSTSSQHFSDETNIEKGINAKNSRFVSHSVESTPAKRGLLSKTAKSLENNLDVDFVECPKLEKSYSQTSSVKELPLLSIFERSVESHISKDKSCSMVNLAEKRNLKTLLGNSNLGNIQAVSIERLASARQNLVGAVSEKTSEDSKLNNT